MITFISPTKKASPFIPFSEKKLLISWLFIILLCVRAYGDGYLNFDLNYNKYKDRESITDSISYQKYLRLFSKQTYNYTLKKYQKKKSAGSEITLFDGVGAFMSIRQEKDESENYQMYSDKLVSGLKYNKSLPRNITLDSRTGYKKESYDYEREDDLRRIENNGFYHNSKVASEYKNISANIQMDLNGQSRTPYWNSFIRKRFFYNTNFMKFTVNANLNRGNFTLPQEDFTQLKSVLSYNLTTDLALSFLEKHRIEARIIADSLERAHYENKSEGAVYRKRKLELFQETVNWSYEFTSDLEFRFSETYREDKVGFLQVFNSFVYRYYMFDMVADWDRGLYRVLFHKSMEKDYFHYIDPLNFSDNDQVRDLVSLKVFFRPGGKKVNITSEFNNTRKKLVYISEYLSANNMFEDNYKLISNIRWKPLSFLEVSNGFKFEANYIYYEYNEQQNVLLRIFDYLLKVRIFFPGNWVFVASNNMKNRDNGPYLLYPDDKYRYLKNSKRIRKLVGFNLNGNILKFDFETHLSWRTTDYYRLEDIALTKSRRNREFSGGIKIKSGENLPYRISVHLSREHFYGYKYWVLDSRILFNF